MQFMSLIKIFLYPVIIICFFFNLSAKAQTTTINTDRPDQSDGVATIGKNNFQNDELTFKFANGGDWWFHAKGMPGSHVVLQTNGRDVPDRTFEEAAALAAFYSKAKNQDKVEVDYLQRKNVKKPNGSMPGFVVYYTNFSMVIAPEVAGLKLL